MHDLWYRLQSRRWAADMCQPVDLPWFWVKRLEMIEAAYDAQRRSDMLAVVETGGKPGHMLC